MSASRTPVHQSSFTEATTAVRAKFRDWQHKIACGKFDDVDDEMVDRRLVFLRGPVVTGARLADYLREELDVTGPISAPPLPSTSASDMNDYPLEWEVRVYEALSDVTLAQASDPVTWCLWHIAWLEEGRFIDDPRATFNAERVNPVPERASDMDASQKKALDNDIRNFLRRLGGFLTIRSTHVAQDPPIAEAWWRRRLATIAAEGTSDAPVPMDRDACHRVLRNGGWSWFIDRGRASYANLLHARALGAVCCAARDAPDINLPEIMRAVARRCEHHHPQLLDFTRLSAPPAAA